MTRYYDFTPDGDCYVNTFNPGAGWQTKVYKANPTTGRVNFDNVLEEELHRNQEEACARHGQILRKWTGTTVYTEEDGLNIGEGGY